MSSQVSLRARSRSERPPGVIDAATCSDGWARFSPLIKLFSGLAAVSIAPNLDHSIAKLRLGVFIPERARLDDMPVSVDYPGHERTLLSAVSQINDWTGGIVKKRGCATIARAASRTDTRRTT